MSFILDALKKAEAERQRQTGPTLLEVRVTPPRRRVPLWTLVIGVLLGVNVLLLLVFVLRRPAAPPTPSAPIAAAPAPASPLPAATSQAAPTAAAPAAPMAAQNGPAPVPQLQAAPPADPTAVPPPTRSTTYPSAVANTPTVSPGPEAMPSAPDVISRGDIGGGPGGDNPADYEPAVPANRAGATGGSARSNDGSAHSEPPSLAEIGGDLPNLRLDLHVYSNRPADRYALINMHRVHEGDVLPEGPRVVAIQADGVELNYRGQSFMLHPQ
jgi:general secretion pathway protein B